MKTIQRSVFKVTLLLLVLGITGCSNMTTRDKNTAIGAGVGAAAGAILTGGGLLGTVGGAAIGGVIGGNAEKSKK